MALPAWRKMSCHCLVCTHRISSLFACEKSDIGLLDGVKEDVFSSLLFCMYRVSCLFAGIESDIGLFDCGKEDVLSSLHFCTFAPTQSNLHQKLLRGGCWTPVPLVCLICTITQNKAGILD